MIKVFIVSAIVNNSFIGLLTQFFMGFLSGKSDPVNKALHRSTKAFSPKMLPEINV